ncbi:MAG: glycoside hydrolase family 28 protein [Marinilabiliaceae bacterium]|nr:glycoside hydrolase family 28 protein [Marinilabiliaceae bacterium]
MKLLYRLLLFSFLLSFIWVEKSFANENEWAKADVILSRISDPVFPDKTFVITSYGASQKSGFNSQKAIQKAIDVCNKKGGGKVIIPKGEYYTGPLTLKSNVNLHLEEGAVLKFSNKPSDYAPFVVTRWEGMDCINYRPLIYAEGQENIAITGEGLLDGQADNDSWWYMKGRKEYGWKDGLNSQEHGGGRDRLMDMVKRNVPTNKRLMTDNDCLRPQFINPTNCKNVLIDGVTIIRAPFWIVHPLFCSNVTVRSITVKSHGPNNDGCDPESCKDVLIENCTFDTGDDCIAIKSGRNNDGRRSGVASENIIVRNCNMKDGHGGVVIGSEISAGCHYVFVENCKMDSPNLDRVIRIKSNTVRGGDIDHLYVRNIEVGECAEAVFRVEFKYEPKDGKGDYPPTLKNVVLENVNCNKSKYGVYIEGIDDSIQVSDVKFINCSFKNVKQTSKISGASNIVFKSVDFEIDNVK